MKKTVLAESNSGPPPLPKDSQSGSSYYGPTSWTIILQYQANGPQWQEAAVKLYQQYQEPILAQFRLRGFRDPEEWCQKFMADVFFPKLVSDAQASKGRFRGFLGLVLHRFMVDVWRRRNHNPLDHALSLDAPEDPLPEPAAPPTQEQVQAELDRGVALTAMNCALAKLRAQYAQEDKIEEFELFAQRIQGETTQSYVQIGEAWGTSVENVKQKAITFRSRFKHAFTQEAKELVPEGESVVEAKYLFRLFYRQS